MTTIRADVLTGNPELPPATAERLRFDAERFSRNGLPRPLELYVRDAYDLDLATTYAGLPVKNPFAKASGQLSMNPVQVTEDAVGGLGYCVLKTVIAQNSAGAQSMHAWAVPESRMTVERTRGSLGDEGWTVSWKGRGWPGPFEDYLALVRAATRIGDEHHMLVVPSCKYHLRSRGESHWRTDEYEHTTHRLLAAAQRVPNGPIAIEKDFSPTLAGSNLADATDTILDWLRNVPALIRRGAGDQPVRVALKLFNARFDDAFQVQMLELITGLPRGTIDAVVYANRLFDPAREVDGHRGIAVGGPDLSQRNLRVLADFQAQSRVKSNDPLPSIEFSATGDISCGRIAVEYLLCGCKSYQMHTIFQLPGTEFTMRGGSRTEKVLHRLLFDPGDGFIAWTLHVARRLKLSPSPLRLIDLAGRRPEFLAAS